MNLCVKYVYKYKLTVASFYLPDYSYFLTLHSAYVTLLIILTYTEILKDASEITQYCVAMSSRQMPKSKRKIEGLHCC